MSRPIKFRVWDEQNKRMLGSDCVDLLIDFSGRVNSHDTGVLNGYNNTPQYPIMQYTGVHDDTEEQAELFDGDIAEVEYEGQKHICKVKYCGGGYMFVADSLPDSYLWLSEFIEFDREYCWAEGTKKLGNIHDHPYLLEAAQ
ncbi:YopX family protein [Paenibacillus lutrae]|uniref:YopX protein domain-containing protein n=1 Tax=Paenibacillus lutrae TaxID=2078573 RepID=A0A7X3JZN4_9BACL|nr:YopX family protein [Paenibacillus lutrae]MVP00369.1 hypothetical protein [Paenibacillus lutrae]